MVAKTKFGFVIIIYVLIFPIILYGKPLTDNQQFSENLEKLRDIVNDLSLQNKLLVDLIVNNPNFREDLALGFFIMHVSEISSLSHVYILQLNGFDAVIEKRTGRKALKIPKKSIDQCCWKNISIVHMQVRFRTQETSRDDEINKINSQSPQILHQLKNTLEKLNICLIYFDNYFVNTEE